MHSIYGSELWFCNESAIGQLKQFGIGYHKVIKKLLGVSYHESNHFACQESRMFTFENLINKEKFTATFRYFAKPCSFIAKLIDYLSISSYLLREVQDILHYKYDVDSLLDNDVDAIVSRVIFVQNREHQMRETWN